ncbi:DNA repair protein, putative [Trypanosoma cruzi marinkellei]|uniref:DNA repair protein, putative n=1 Tax=Trypanosoma cruzi marinkellei TaxID=85056 RepID=K2N583_TRYCR|nr:DNA repair protein, putative [Trypanosoma cruzi marinkellei]
MTLMHADKPLAATLQRLLPGLAENPTESVLVDTLLRCCHEWGVTAETELLLLLTSGCPFVQRRIMLTVRREQRRQPFCHPAEVQRFLQKVLLALSTQHVTQQNTRTSLEASRNDFGLASLSRSLESLLCMPAGEGSAPAQAFYGGSPFFTTGCPSLDHLLSGGYRALAKDASDGGFRAGFLSEVYGEAGSGKTQLVLQSLLHCVAQHLCDRWHPSGAPEICSSGLTTGGVAALYIVSEDFPAARLAALAAGTVEREKRRVLRLSAHLPPSTVDRLKVYLEREVTVNSVIRGLHVRRVGTLKELVFLLHSGTLSRAFHALGGRGMVAVDSIAGAAGAGDGANGDDGGGEMRTDVMLVGKLLKTFAVHEKAAVVVTNQVRAVLSGRQQQRHGGKDAVTPALGVQWSLAPHVRIHLRRLQGTGGTTHRKLIVLSGPSNPPLCGGYVIGEDGICGDL